MLFTSPVYSQVSGSIAGITYAHSRSGLITKPRSTPTNPNTARQRTIRHAIARLGSYWGQILTETERAAWRLYSDNVTWTNPLGQTTYLTGSQHFTRCNVPRIQASIDILAAAPTIYDLGTFTPPHTVLISDKPELGLIFVVTDDWANGAGGHMLIWTSKSVGPGNSFYRSPWRYTGKVDGAPVPPPPFVILPGPWPWGMDNLAWVKIRYIQTDGRLSLPVILGPETVTVEEDFAADFGDVIEDALDALEDELEPEDLD